MKNGPSLSRRVPAAAMILAAAVSFGVVDSARAAGGINLSWSDCGVAGVSGKTFAATGCSTLSGAIMIASAETGTEMPELNGEESVLDLETNQATLYPWWHLEAGGCRGPTAISSSFDFTGGPFTCIDPWSGQAAGGMNYTAGYGGANRARIRTVAAIPGSTAISGTDEYYFFKITLLFAKSTGNGSCAGYTDGVCITFNSLKLTQPVDAPGGDLTLTNSLFRNYVTFQSGGASIGCPGATPTRNRTWGSVKALYRSCVVSDHRRPKTVAFDSRGSPG